jgi:hypothetical protein
MTYTTYRKEHWKRQITNTCKLAFGCIFFYTKKRNRICKIRKISANCAKIDIVRKKIWHFTPNVRESAYWDRAASKAAAAALGLTMESTVSDMDLAL